MLGIGFGELVIFFIILLMVVGPNKMPVMLKSLLGTYRDFRRTARDLRASTGIDEILQDEDIKSLRDPLRIPPARPKGASPKEKVLDGNSGPVVEASPRAAELEDEYPTTGVDVEEAYLAESSLGSWEPKLSPEEQAVIDAKLAAAAAQSKASSDEVSAEAAVAGVAPTEQDTPTVTGSEAEA